MTRPFAALFGIALVAGLWSPGPLATATPITFDAVPSSGNPIVTTLTTEGFTFNSAHFHTVDSPTIATFGGAVDNGTIYINEENGSLGAPITMTEVGSVPFDLFSFDGAEVFLDSAAAAQGGFPNADFIDVVANLSGGGTVSASFALDGIKDGAGGVADFENFVFPSTFRNLSSATFSGSLLTGGAGGISLDNIDAAPIPEPASVIVWSLLATVALAVGCRRQKRRAA